MPRTPLHRGDIVRLDLSILSPHFAKGTMALAEVASQSQQIGVYVTGMPKWFQRTDTRLEVVTGLTKQQRADIVERSVLLFEHLLHIEDSAEIMQQLRLRKMRCSGTLLCKRNPRNYSGHYEVRYHPNTDEVCIYGVEPNDTQRLYVIPRRQAISICRKILKPFAKRHSKHGVRDITTLGNGTRVVQYPYETSVHVGCQTVPLRTIKAILRKLPTRKPSTK